MARIVFVVSDHVGHLHATLRMRAALNRRGHSVVYLGSGAVREVIDRERLSFESMPSLEELSWPDSVSRQIGRAIRTPHATILARRQMAAKWRELAERLQTDIAQIVRSLAPDLVLFDPFLFPYAPAFLAHGIPAALLSANVLLDPDPLVPPYTTAVVPSPSVWGRVRVAAARRYAGTCVAIHRLRCATEELLSGASSAR